MLSAIIDHFDDNIIWFIAVISLLLLTYNSNSCDCRSQAMYCSIWWTAINLLVCFHHTQCNCLYNMFKNVLYDSTIKRKRKITTLYLQTKPQNSNIMLDTLSHGWFYRASIYARAVLFTYFAFSFFSLQQRHCKLNLKVTYSNPLNRLSLNFLRLFLNCLVFTNYGAI